jgi:hypothetical protein
LAEDGSTNHPSTGRRYLEATRNRKGAIATSPVSASFMATSAIAFRLKTLGLACGTDRANSGGPPRRRVCCRTAKYPFPGTFRGAIHVYRNCQLLRVVCKASQFQAQFTLREETNHNRFCATAGRAAKKLGQSQKFSQREFRQSRASSGRDFETSGRNWCSNALVAFFIFFALPLSPTTNRLRHSRRQRRWSLDVPP